MSRCCPECGSCDTEKDRDPFRGGDSGDRKCNSCGHIGWYTTFDASLPSHPFHKRTPK